MDRERAAGIRQLVGSRLGPYKLIQCIGAGGSAGVFRAQKDDEDGFVALKVSGPRSKLTRYSTARFLREVKAIERVHHEACVRVLDWGIESERIYIAMELVKGDDLSSVLADGDKLPPTRAVSIAMALCEVLEHAHPLGVVHRDIKPQNIKVLEPDRSGRERVKLMDFGLAKIFYVATDAGEDSIDEPTHAVTLTEPAALLGTPGYLAPEQVGSHDNVDGRTDLFSVGVVLYRMLTGRVPYQGRDALAFVTNLVTETPPLPSELVGRIPLALDAIVMRCLARAPADRFDSATDLKDALASMMPALEEASHRDTTDVMRSDGHRFKGPPPLTETVDAPARATRRAAMTEPMETRRIAMPPAEDEDGQVTKTLTTRLQRPKLPPAIDDATVLVSSQPGEPKRDRRMLFALLLAALGLVLVWRAFAG